MGMEQKVEQLGPALLEAFQRVPDPRRPLGRRYPLPAILSLAVCAMLCNCHSLYAIHQKDQKHETSSAIPTHRYALSAIASQHDRA